MNVHLMFNDNDFLPDTHPQCPNHETLTDDLGLSYIIDTMAGGDEIMRASCTAALLSPLSDCRAILYRQQILTDALEHPDCMRILYNITTEARAQEKRSLFWLSGKELSGIFSNAIGLLQIYVKMLQRLRAAADIFLPLVKSDGLRNLFTQFEHELDDAYFNEVSDYLTGLENRKSILIGAKFGSHLQGTEYALLENEEKEVRHHWRFAPSYTLAEQDGSGTKDFEMRIERALNESTDALAQSAEHLQHFFAALQYEAGFYIGCCNLMVQMRKTGMPFCLPHVVPFQSASQWSSCRLYDVSLMLVQKSSVVWNDFEAGGKNLCIVTGANQGGKSTFLRSIGQAQLMAQCGMCVGAEQLTVSVKSGIFTHFKKEEDSALNSGKLDEELARMDSIAGHLKPDALVLFNESFAATNEREGSEISRQIVCALMEHRITVVFVTHQYEFAEYFYTNKTDTMIFLRAERQNDGARTFKISAGAPMKKSFASDIFSKIFPG
ncbi:MAG: hypothetical protein M0P01_10415 [Treponema sp.]|nr:hypothetical protein [Treponema sp.]